ncbi:hypothetical protein [Chitinimonas sp. BJYL2]|uniref:hypothetical protein n=1 Tax=Chitinimonas sp. BJYL2 TaxID=2976696 RepID=UPI0022B44883|nr:hypothetical protein [Chitinimonas sp. BJYL2]
MNKSVFFVAALITSNAIASDFLSPGVWFNTPTLTLRSPNADGWVKSKASSSSIVFNKRIGKSNDYYTAGVALFKIKGNATTEEMSVELERLWQKNFPSEKFVTTSSEVKNSDRKDMNCLLKQSQLTDASTQEKPNSKVIHTVRSLYCKHPVSINTGFVVNYMHSGLEVDTTFEEQSNWFFDAVQIPKPQEPESSSMTESSNIKSSDK